MEREHKIYQELSVAIQARKNCQQSNNVEWFDRWTERIADLSELLPSGSGFDNGTKVDLDASHADKLVLHTAFHHMHESGMYDRWTDHTVIVTPSFRGINMRITGRDYRGIKDYMREEFDIALCQDAPQLTV